MQIKLSRPQLDNKRAELKALGVELSGDAGQVQHSGVTLNYSYNGDVLDIEIAHKPFFVPTSTVENQITAWFAGSSGKSGISSSLGSLVALLLLPCILLTGCTPQQQQNTKAVMAKVISYAPEVQLAEDSLASTISLFQPQDAALIQVSQVAFDAAKAALIVAANAYIATPNDGALASVRAALEQVLAVNADQFLSAARISNPVSLAAAKAAIVAVREVLLLMDGALQTTQSKAASVATAAVAHLEAEGYRAVCRSGRTRQG